MTRNQLSPYFVGTSGRVRSGLARPLLMLALVIPLASFMVALGLLPAFGGAGNAVKGAAAFFEPINSAPFEVPKFPQRSTIYAADGSVLATVFLDENRKLIELRHVNPITRKAVLAIEDDGFYEHGPINPVSIIRAAVSNLRAGKVVQGGSTITQQLVKNTVTSGERTLERKIREAQDAIRLEKQYSKDQILELYLNQVYWGHGVYGLGAAAEYYFNQKVRDLTLPQAALLAGLIAAPETWDPVDYPDKARARRDEVLGRMLSLRWITETQHAEATATPIQLSDKGRTANKPGSQPYFVRYVIDQILNTDRYAKWFGKTYNERKLALFQGGLRIHTTLQPRLQKLAKDAIDRRLPNQGPEPPKDPEGAVVSIVPNTGAILTMACGVDFSKFKFNLCAQSRRSTGSAAKAFTLAAAFEQNFPVGKVYDSKTPIFIPECNDWTVNNAEPGSGGYMNLTDATAASVNVVFAQLTRDVGPEHVAAVTERMGIGTDVPPFCAISLGAVDVSPLQMTAAYSTLANGGAHCKPFAITKVMTHEEKTLFKARPQCEQVLRPEVAAQVTSLLQGVVTHGTGTAANIGRPVAGKTGTGQEYRDAWFMGYIPQLVTGVWVGYSKAEIPMRALPVLGYGNAFGGTIAAPIWHDYMAPAVAGMPVLGFPEPPPPQSGTVPDVVGKKLEEAEKILSEASFTPIPKEIDSGKPAGTVVKQAPAGGTEAVLGIGVTIFISNGKGPPEAEVPNVIGLTQEDAASALAARGFRVAVQYEIVKKNKEAGIVLAQAPAPRTHLEKGRTVTIVVGKLEEPEPTPTPSPTEP